jgi:glycerol kinase
LSGASVHASDHSNLSSSGVYDLLNGSFDERVLSELSLEPRWLPEVVDSSAVLGETDVRTFGAAVPIASLAGDQHAAMYAQACHAPGSVKLSLGTSGMMQLHVGEEIATPGPGAYPLVLWSLDGTRQFCHEGATLTAGAAAQWLRDGLGLVADLAQIEALARSVPSSDGVWAVPAFQGLGTPHLDLDARGLIGGLANDARPGGAVLEGTPGDPPRSDSLAAPSEALGRIRVDGGAATNDLLLEPLADFTGVAIERPMVHESVVLGAPGRRGSRGRTLERRDVAARWRGDRLSAPRRGRAGRGASAGEARRATREAAH